MKNKYPGINTLAMQLISLNKINVNIYYEQSGGYIPEEFYPTLFIIINNKSNLQNHLKNSFFNIKYI